MRIPSAVTFLILLGVAGPQAFGQRAISPEEMLKHLREMELRRLESPRRRVARPAVPRRAKRNPNPILWRIPKNRFGLMLKDGTRIIGRPGKDWSAELRTSFGHARIPRDQIRSIESLDGKSVAIHLTNEDRVSGVLITQTIPFETPFGRLTIPVGDLKELSAVDIVLSPDAAVTGSAIRRIPVDRIAEKQAEREAAIRALLIPPARERSMELKYLRAVKEAEGSDRRSK